MPKNKSSKKKLIDIETAIDLISNTALISTQTVVAVGTSPPAFVLAVLGTALPALMISGAQAYEAKRLRELISEIDGRLDKLDERVVHSDDFAAFSRSVADQYLKETDEEKRKMLRKYYGNAAEDFKPETTMWHEKALSALRVISIKEYGALVDVCKAIESIKAEETKNRSREISFQYGTEIIIARLEKISPRYKDPLSERELDIAIRSLSAMGLVHMCDTSLGKIGNRDFSTEIIGLTPTGHQLIRLIDPEKYDRIVLK